MRVLSWLVVSGMVYRHLGSEAFALVGLVRLTIGVLNYTSLGLLPSMIHYINVFRRRDAAAGAMRVIPLEGPALIPYADAKPEPAMQRVNNSLREIYANGLCVAAITVVVGLCITVVYASHADAWLRVDFSVSQEAAGLVLMMGLGTLCRLASDAAGAVLQAEERIIRDNAMIALAEVLWVVLVILVLRSGTRHWGFSVGNAFFWSGFLLLLARSVFADRRTRMPSFIFKHVHWRTTWMLIKFGAFVTLAQLADYLYAPTDVILISRLIDAKTVAVYWPAVQIDGGLLLLVGAIASVLLPRSAMAHASGEVKTLRDYYVRGTLASVGILSFAGAAVYVAAPVFFKLWFGDSMPATRAILPLVLVHTVVGGSSAVGRSILLGMGKVRAFTAAVLIAGAVNVVLSFVFVRYFGLGLRGIILGTIVAVVGRCAIWMPWYVMRQLRRAVGVAEEDLIEVEVPPMM